MISYSSYMKDVNRNFQGNFGNYSYNNSNPSLKIDKSIVRSAQTVLSPNLRTPTLEYKNKRTNLDRAFDALLTPLYATAGWAYGTVSDEITPWEGFSRGLRAGNPFGKGFEPGEYTYSRVLEAAGWKPQSTAGRIARGTVGLGLDIFLDPTTYLSGGLTALVKGTGTKGLAKTHKGALEAIKALGKDFDLSKGMTTEIATDLILKSNKSSGIKASSAEILETAIKFTDEYNKLIGVQSVAKPIELSLANAPFGEKIFGKLADKRFTISSGDMTRAISDKIGISTAYSVLRDKIFGSAIGKRFSTSHPLYKLSKINPEGVFHWVKFVEVTRGLGIDKTKAIIEITENANKIFGDLTPAELKRLISDLQKAPSKEEASAIASIKLLETKEARQIRLDLENKRKVAEQTIKDIEYTNELINNALNRSDSSLDSIKKEIVNLESRRSELIKTIDVENIQSRNDLHKLLTTLNSEAENLTKLYNDHSFERFFQTVRSKNIDTLINDLKKVHDSGGNASDFIIAKQPVADTISVFVFGEKGHVPISATSENMSFLYKTADKMLKLNKKITNDKNIDKIRLDIEDIIESTIKYIDDTHYKGKSAIINRQLDDYLKLKYDIQDVNLAKRHEPDRLLKLDLFSNREATLKYIDELNAKYSPIHKSIKSKYEPSEDELSKIRNIFRSIFGDSVDNYSSDLLIKMYKNPKNIAKYDFSSITKSDKLFITELENKLSKTIFKNVFEPDLIKINQRDVLKYNSLVENIFGKTKISDGRIVEIIRKEGIDSLLSKKNVTSSNITKSDIEFINAMAYKLLRRNREQKEMRLLVNFKLADIEYKKISKMSFSEKDKIAKYSDFNKIVSETWEAAEYGVKFNYRNPTYTIKDDIHDRLKSYNLDTLGYEKVSNKLLNSISKEVNLLMKNYFSNIDYFKLPNNIRNDIFDLAYARMEGIIKHSSQNDMYIKLADKIESLGSRVLKGAEKNVGLSKSNRGINKVELARQNNKLISSINDARREYDDAYKALVEIHNGQLLDNNIVKDITKDIDFLKSNEELLLKTMSDRKEQLVKNLNDTKVLEEEIKFINNTLDNENALVTYTEAILKDMGVEIPKSSSLEITLEIMDARQDVSDSYKKAYRFVRESFAKVGQKEVDAGLLTQGQLDTMLKHYVPHILTPEGQEYISKLKKGVNEVDDTAFKFFSDDFGFGMVENIHGKSRTIKDAYIDDKLVKNPTIGQINDYFRERLNGADLFSEDIANVFFARMLRHNDLMYDKNLTNTMLTEFGSVFTGEILNGYKLVGNHATLTEVAYKAADMNVSMHISDAVGKYLKKNKDAINYEVKNRLASKGINSTKTNFFEFNVIFRNIKSEVTREYSGRFINETFPDHIVNELKTNYHKNFLESTGLGESLSSGLPMSHITVDGYNAIHNSINSLSNFYFENIRSRASGLLADIEFYLSGISVPKSAFRILDDMTSYELKEYLISISEFVDGADKVRLQGYAKNLDSISDLTNFDIMQVHDTIVDRANRLRKIQMRKDTNSLLQLYDKFTYLLKLNMTTVMPGWHSRNKQSNIFNNWLHIGADAYNLDLQKASFKTLFDGGKNTDTIKILKNGREVDMTFGELYALAVEHSALDIGYYAVDIAKEKKSMGMMKHFGVSGKVDITDTDNFIPYKMGTKLGSYIEDSDRFIHFISVMKRGGTPQQAAESSRKFLFDYSDITEFEANVMKRIIPFYTWLRKNSALQLEQLIENPGKYRDVAKFMSGIESSVLEEDRINKEFVNDFAADWVQTPFFVTNPEGRKEPVLWNPNLPFMELSDMFSPFHPGDSMKELFSRTNPIFKVPIEQAMNWNTFFESRITKPTNTTREKISKRTDHALQSVGWHNIAKGMFQKKDEDLGLHMLAHTTGVKFLSYDYDKYKQIKIQEMLRKMEGK